jgi:hypothetical protein
MTTPELRAASSVARPSWGCAPLGAAAIAAVTRAPVVYGLALLVLVTGIVHDAAFFHDDAFITLRYAARWLAGQGVTWNSGEYVEGFTHPLWLAQAAALGALGVDLEIASRVLGVSYLVGLVLLWRLARAEPMVLLVAMTQPGLLLWSLGGLETTAFAFWVALGAWLTQEAVWAGGNRLAQRWAIGAGVALGAASLMRPEGIGVGAVAIAVAAGTRQWRAAAAVSLGFAAVAGSYEGLRLWYFGDLLANTAYAKLGGLPIESRAVAGLAYLWENQDCWLPALVVTAAAFLLASGRRPIAMVLIPTPIVACVLMAGGDHMPAGRLIVPLAITLLFAAAIAARGGLRHRGVLTCMVGLIAAAQFGALLLTPTERDAAAVTGEHVGAFLQRHLPAGATVATATAGSTPYFAPSLRFIDTLGLNDRHIARREVAEVTTKWQSTPGHLKGDGAYVLARNPDVIILGPAFGFIGDPPTEWFLTDFELLKTPQFRDHYRPYRFVVPVAPESIARRPLPSRADANPHVVLVLYLRRDSPAVGTLTTLGAPMALPPHV